MILHDLTCSWRKLLWLQVKLYFWNFSHVITLIAIVIFVFTDAFIDFNWLSSFVLRLYFFLAGYYFPVTIVEACIVCFVLYLSSCHVYFLSFCLLISFNRVVYALIHVWSFDYFYISFMFDFYDIMVLLTSLWCFPPCLFWNVDFFSQKIDYLILTASLCSIMMMLLLYYVRVFYYFGVSFLFLT